MRRPVLALMLLAIAAGPAAAAVIHVNAEGTGDKPTIAAALESAVTGDTILVAAGLYLGPGNTQLDFAGKDVVLMGAGPDSTILDCEDSGVEAVRFTNGETRAAVLRDMTIHNNRHHFIPVGIVIDSASPTLINLHLTNLDGEGNDDHGDWYMGGALSLTFASPLIEDVLIWDCSPAGAIGAMGGAPQFEHVLIDYCGSIYLPAGGLYFNQCAARLHDVIIRRCVGGDYSTSGGVTCWGNPSPVFEDCVFENNEQMSELGGPGDVASGGLLCVDGAAPVLRRCSFIGNSSLNGAGGLYCSSNASPTLEDVLFADNRAACGGSAVVISTASATLRRVTITGSRFHDWGHWYNAPSSILCFGSSPLLEQLLVAHNEVGVGIWIDAASAPAIICSDFFGNPDGNYGGALADQTGISGNISEDPRFCDAGAGDYSLDALSPCLPENNDCGLLMGTYGQGCDLTPADDAPPAVFSLAQNHPNPFNPVTTLRFGLPRQAAVSLAIYSAGGRLVARLLKGERLPAGYHSITWRGQDDRGQAQPSGVYFARFAAEGYLAERKLVLLK